MITLTKKEEKLITSLKQKKFRKQENLFVVEGKKIVEEAIASGFDIKYVVSSNNLIEWEGESRVCDEKTMSKLSTLKTPPGILAVITIPSTKQVKSSITLVLDGVRDPGNLGTIIRTAEVMGVKSIVLSEDTVDLYSSKVVQATMGSIFRVDVCYKNLITFFKENSEIPVFGAHLGGENVYCKKIKTPCCLVMGSESHGISDAIMQHVSDPIKIPMQGQAESLNVSIATAILLGEFSRQIDYL